MSDVYICTPPEKCVVWLAPPILWRGLLCYNKWGRASDCFMTLFLYMYLCCASNVGGNQHSQ